VNALIAEGNRSGNLKIRIPSLQHLLADEHCFAFAAMQRL
jgi:hypothetical protein